jgi:3-methyladenine DNA glycosylase/8-oxoguanine DNA glycosylase
MRAFGDPDACPVGDLGLRKAIGKKGTLASAAEVAAAAEAWRPFRAYATLHVWSSLGGG